MNMAASGTVHHAGTRAELGLVRLMKIACIVPMISALLTVYPTKTGYYLVRTDPNLPELAGMAQNFHWRPASGPRLPSLQPTNILEARHGRSVLFYVLYRKEMELRA